MNKTWKIILSIMCFLIVLGLASDAIHDGIMIYKCTRHQDLELLWHGLKYLINLILLSLSGLFLFLLFNIIHEEGLIWRRFIITLLVYIIVLIAGHFIWEYLFEWAKIYPWPAWA